MTAPAAECANCGAKTPDQLCGRCVRKVEKWAAEMPALVADLESVIARQSRVGTGAATLGASTVDQPLPLNADAVPAREHVDAFLEWAWHIVADAGPMPRAGRSLAVADARRLVTDASLAILLAASWFRTSPEAAACMNAMWSTRVELLRAVDRRPTARWFAGPCGHVKSWAGPDVCDLALFARPAAGDDTAPPPIVCDGHNDRDKREGCGTVHTWTNRRAFLLVSVADELLPLDAILPALPGLIGRNPDRATVRQWRARGSLVPHGATPAGVDLYRGGDVLDLALANTGKPGRKRKPRSA